MRRDERRVGILGEWADSRIERAQRIARWHEVYSLTYLFPLMSFRYIEAACRFFRGCGFLAGDIPYRMYAFG